MQCRGLTIWEVTPKKIAIGSADLIIGEKASRSTIHDELSTILRSNKVKNLTVQMTNQGNAVVPAFIALKGGAATEPTAVKMTEDDLNSIS